MGFGLPAAIGAKVARPDALVIDVDGDASFSMTLTELSTMAQFNIGAKIIILNNVSVVQGISLVCGCNADSNFCHRRSRVS